MDNGFNCLQASSVFKIICFNFNRIVDQSCMPYQIYDFYKPPQVCFLDEGSTHQSISANTGPVLFYLNLAVEEVSNSKLLLGH